MKLMTTKWTTLLTAALCLVAALSIGLFSGQQEALAAEPAKIGDPAPTFTLPSVTDGTEVSLDAHKGKVVVLMFHSTTCPFYEMKENQGYDRVFVKMVEDYKDKDVVFLGVNSDRTQSVDKIKKYVEKHDINYTVLKDEGNKVADAYGAKVTPHVMVIDKQGKFRYRGGVEKISGGPNTCGESDTQYLGPVIDALLDGTEITVPTETKATGCGIKRVK